MKKYKSLKECTKEELEKVWDKNDKLKNKVYDDFIENEMFWVSEMLDYITESLSNCSIGFYQNNTITVRDNRKFLVGLLELHKAMEVFYNDNELLNEINQALNNNTENIQNITNKVLEMFNGLTKHPLDDDIKEFYYEVFLDKMQVIKDGKAEIDNYFINKNYVLYKNTVECYV